MAKYRKKPVVIEAVQYIPGTALPLGVQVVDQNSPDDCKQCDQPYTDHGWIQTLEGGHIACPKDWIITGVAGEHYPCKPDIFEATYDKEPAP